MTTQQASIEALASRIAGRLAPSSAFLSAGYRDAASPLPSALSDTDRLASAIASRLASQRGVFLDSGRAHLGVMAVSLSSTQTAEIASAVARRIASERAPTQASVMPIKLSSQQTASLASAIASRLHTTALSSAQVDALASAIGRALANVEPSKIPAPDLPLNDEELDNVLAEDDE